MPIAVQHGPNQSHYASIMADAARRNTNFDRNRDIADFWQNVKQQNREYELGKESNRLTGRGQDIQYDLGLKDVGLKQQQLEQEAQRIAHDIWMGKQDVEIRKEGLSQNEQAMRNDMIRAYLSAFMSNPQAAMNATGANPVFRDNRQQAQSAGFLSQVMPGGQGYYSTQR